MSVDQTFGEAIPFPKGSLWDGTCLTYLTVPPRKFTKLSHDRNRNILAIPAILRYISLIDLKTRYLGKTPVLVAQSCNKAVGFRNDEG
jgi:hypothetical protein